MTRIDHFVNSARYPPANGQEYQLCARNVTPWTPVSLLVNPGRRTKRAQNTSSPALKVSKSDKSVDSAHFTQKWCKSDDSARFITFCSFTRRFTGVPDQNLTFIPGINGPQPLIKQA